MCCVVRLRSVPVCASVSAFCLSAFAVGCGVLFGSVCSWSASLSVRFGPFDAALLFPIGNIRLRRLEVARQPRQCVTSLFALR